VSVQEETRSRTLEGWFESELERRLAKLDDPAYRETAEHLQPLPREHWRWIFVLALPIPLVIALVSYFTW
jgi:hypothetical protein